MRGGMSPPRISRVRVTTPPGSGVVRLETAAEVGMAEDRCGDRDEELVMAGGERPHAGLSDRALIDAMRARDGEAVEEFIRRFQHLVFVQAKRLRIPGSERRRWVGDLLVEVASSLARRRRDAPRAVAPYLVTAAKRKAFAERRQQLARERLANDLASELGGAGERALVDVCSQGSVRDTHGPGWEEPAMPAALMHLVERLDAQLSAAERQLLSWMAHRVPYATIAQWLGITRAAAIKRGTRLRARLVEVVLELGASFEAPERAELLRFLRRTGRFEEGELSRLEPDAQRARDAPGRCASTGMVGETARSADARRVAESRTTYPLDGERHERGGHGTE